MATPAREPMAAMTKPRHITLSPATPKLPTPELALFTDLRLTLATSFCPEGPLVATLNPVRSSPSLAKCLAHLNLHDYVGVIVTS